MLDDLNRLRTALNAFTDLPPLLDDADGPVVVRRDDVRRLAAQAADVVERIALDHERIAARLSRYDQLKKYTRDVERRLKSALDRLATIGNLAK